MTTETEKITRRTRSLGLAWSSGPWASNGGLAPEGLAELESPRVTGSVADCAQEVIDTRRALGQSCYIAWRLTLRGRRVVGRAMDTLDEIRFRLDCDGSADVEVDV